jgi:aminopeptidase-like protein
MSMTDLIRKLSPYRSGVVCDGLDTVTKLLCEEEAFTVHEFKSGETVNGWTVPQKWECQKAIIRNSTGLVIYDGNEHPLGVCAYSDSFEGAVSGAELKKHLFYSNAYDDALVYHCDWWYKPWARTWGFSVNKTFYALIKDDAQFHVELVTTLEPGTMKCLEYVLPGKSSESIMLNANNCHPGCANDDLSGCVVGLEVMRLLAGMEERRYTYRLLIAPEHYGSIFYLNRFGKNGIKWALFLESLGSEGPLNLQQSFLGDTMIDRVIQANVNDSHAFRRVVGNDETCWEAAGYEIPCPSLSRCPFGEYHTDKDNADLMSETSLEDAVRTVYSGLRMLETEMVVERKFTGLVCLSNPTHDLYKPMLDPSIPDRRTITHEQRRWNYLMDCLPRYFDQKTLVMDIAERHRVPFFDVYYYIKEWELKGLVRTYPIYMPADHKPLDLPPG